MALTKEQRSLRARLAAQTRWANCRDRRAATRPGTEAFIAKFADAEDPESALRAHMSRLALKSSTKRST